MELPSHGGGDRGDGKNFGPAGAGKGKDPAHKGTGCIKIRHGAQTGEDRHKKPQLPQPQIKAQQEQATAENQRKQQIAQGGKQTAPAPPSQHPEKVVEDPARGAQTKSRQRLKQLAGNGIFHYRNMREKKPP